MTDVFTTKVGARAHPITQNIPLPGNYPCLTLQLNITRYASQQMGKMVLVVREPSDGVEISRLSSEVGPWEQLQDIMATVIEQQMRNMEYMQDATHRD